MCAKVHGVLVGKSYDSSAPSHQPDCQPTQCHLSEEAAQSNPHVRTHARNKAGRIDTLVFLFERCVFLCACVCAKNSKRTGPIEIKSKIK